MSNNRTKIYYNRGKSNMFRVYVGVTLAALKCQLEQINDRLNHKYLRRMDSVDYCCSSIDSYECVPFTEIKL